MNNSKNSIYASEYGYDLNNNVSRFTSSAGGTSVTESFEYGTDDLAKNCTEVYTYDNGGNILSIVRYPLTWGSLDGVTATRTTNYAYDDTNRKDKMTSFNNLDITYDEIGNPLQYKGFTLTWQNGRQLASMQFMQMRFEFTYDVDGLRTSKKIPNVGSEHKYYYVGSRLQYETLDNNSALYYFYDSDGNPSGIRYKNGSTFTDYYYVCNWRGDVVEIYNSAGVLVASYDYNAWGVTTTHSTDADTQDIADLNPLRYRGYYYDSETSMYYLKSRYYDPATKRFLNADVVAAVNDNVLSNNFFPYCFNNPVIYEDSSGCYTGWDDDAAIIAGGSISVTTELIFDAMSGSMQSKEHYVASFMGGALGGWISLYYPSLSGAVSGGASSLIEDFLNMNDDGFSKEPDKIFIDAFTNAAKGLVFDWAFSSMADTVFKNSLGRYENRSQAALNKLNSANSLPIKRNSFYSYYGNMFSYSLATANLERLYIPIGFLLTTIDNIF